MVYICSYVEADVKAPLTLSENPCIVRLFTMAVPAGFPSPADDYLDTELDLRDYLVAHPAATFLHIVEGRSMEGAGIMDGDIVVVDRAVEAKPGHVIVAIAHGEKTIKRLKKGGAGGYILQAEPAGQNKDDYPDFAVNESHPFEIWGTVVGVVRRYTA